MTSIVRLINNTLSEKLQAISRVLNILIYKFSVKFCCNDSHIYKRLLFLNVANLILIVAVSLSLF